MKTTTIEMPKNMLQFRQVDDVKGTGVFVLATVNEHHKLPRSLTRSGRFDRCIEVCSPNSQDCVKIIKHYLADKK